MKKSSIVKFGLFALFVLATSLSCRTKQDTIAIIHIRDVASDLLLIMLLVVYIVITAYSPSVIRAGLMFTLIVLNKRLKMNFSNIDILSIIFIFLILINPNYYLNPGFVLSFLVTLLLLLNSNNLKEYKQPERFVSCENLC